jgi:hypothetical protein
MCCCTGVEELGVYGQPHLDLGTLAAPGEGSMLPRDILASMIVWSMSQDALSEWLDRRRRAHPAKLELVIWDDTAFRIPWELFWLGSEVESEEASAGPDGWLGALFTVTRWLTIKMAWSGRLQNFLQLPANADEGPVAAFIDPRMRHDALLLGEFQVEPASSMERLFVDLKKKPLTVAELAGAELNGTDLNTVARPLAMVYVACHGEFGDRLEDIRLGRFPLSRAYQLGGNGLRRLVDRSTLVFLNACRSGSIGIDTGMLNDGAQRGFAEVFLRARAAGVLATTGAVGDDLAHTVARDLFEELRSDPGLPVAEAVRRLREQAAILIAQEQELESADLSPADQKAANSRLLPFVYRFMYVYYGSPRMVLSFISGTGLPGTGDLAAAGEPP